MKTKRLSNGFKLPILSIGTNLMGGEDRGIADHSKDKEHVKAIKDAIKLGYTSIDTAEIYGSGHAEELVGKAIKGFDKKKLTITTKVAKEHLRYEDVLSSAEGSLKRLGIKYIDLYLIHTPNPDIPIKETMKAMDELVKRKMIRYIGVSSFDVKQMKEAQRYSKNKIVANQLKYNLWKKADIKTIEYCQKNNIIVMAYKPFGRGKVNSEKIEALTEIAKKHKKTEAQIILNWITSKKNTVALFKSTSKKHLKENLDISDFKLSEKESKMLDGSVHRS